MRSQVQVLAGPPPVLTSGNAGRRIRARWARRGVGSRTLTWLPFLVMSQTVTTPRWSTSPLPRSSGSCSKTSTGTPSRWSVTCEALMPWARVHPLLPCGQPPLQPAGPLPAWCSAVGQRLAGASLTMNPALWTLRAHSTSRSSRPPSWWTRTPPGSDGALPARGGCHRVLVAIQPAEPSNNRVGSTRNERERSPSRSHDPGR